MGLKKDSKIEGIKDHNNFPGIKSKLSIPVA